MRRAVFHFVMHRLALVAMLLLMAMPVVSRMTSTAQADGAWAQMCTLAGLKWVKLAPFAATVTSAAIALEPVPDLTPDLPHRDGDPLSHCPYCPLLTAFAALLLCAVLLWPRRDAHWRPWWRPSPARWQSHPTGLGSRGPPLTL